MALEIPSGVVADMVSRRVLLTIGPLLSAAGFALWMLAPSYPAFAAGFVLWGAKGAIESGALEALVYEELDRHDASFRYATVMGRATTFRTIAIAAAMGLAAPVFVAGGYEAVGMASVAACVLTAAIGATLPEPRTTAATPAGTDDGFIRTLHAGIGEVRRRRPVLIAVTFLIAVSAIWGSLDEYVPLLAAETGWPTERLPVLILVVYTGVALGGLLAGVGRRLRRRGLGALLMVGAGVLALGALSGHPAGFVLIALAFGAFQLIEIGSDARLQDVIAGPARSTVTSAAGFGTEIAAISIFGGYGLGSAVADHATLFTVAAAGYAVLGLSVVLIGRRRTPAA